MIEGTVHNTLVGIRGNLRKLSVLVGSSFCVLIIVGISTLFSLNQPPVTFVGNTTVTVEKGMTVRSAGELLEAQGVIRSALFFRLLVRTQYPNLSIEAGNYHFDNPSTVTEIIHTLSLGAQETPANVLTFPEGFSVHDLLLYTKDVFSEFDSAAYTQYEGYLFPETYFVSPTEHIDDLILRMRDQFDLRLAPYQERIAASGYSLEEVIILASILEREANDVESMRTVSGILENRLKNDIPLQVDATFEYILGKTSAELTTEDLAIDSPYNTYTHIGLPPTPIANPGIMAIEAVLSPLKTNYYYYLTDKKGNFHYAHTFEEHKRNKELYLK